LRPDALSPAHNPSFRDALIPTNIPQRNSALFCVETLPDSAPLHPRYRSLIAPSRVPDAPGRIPVATAGRDDNKQSLRANVSLPPQWRRGSNARPHSPDCPESTLATALPRGPVHRRANKYPRVWRGQFPASVANSARAPEIVNTTPPPHPF